MVRKEGKKGCVVAVQDLRREADERLSPVLPLRHRNDVADDEAARRRNEVPRTLLRSGRTTKKKHA